MLETSLWAFEVIQEGGLMDGMNILTVLVTGLLLVAELIKAKAEALSGYRGATLDNGLTGKEIRILAGPKYRQIRHTLSHF